MKSGSNSSLKHDALINGNKGDGSPSKGDQSHNLKLDYKEKVRIKRAKQYLIKLVEKKSKFNQSAENPLYGINTDEIKKKMKAKLIRFRMNQDTFDL
jgi:hypothetical protein